MKFLIDAQLPKSLARLIADLGYQSLHTLDLPEKNATTDESITELSLKEHWVVISKDADFYNRFLNKLEPYKLIYLTTGNIPNRELLNIFEKNISRIAEYMETSFLVEISRTSIIIID